MLLKSLKRKLWDFPIINHRLYFDLSKINPENLKKAREILNINSSKEAIKIVLIILATLETQRVGEVLRFPAFDYIENLLELSTSANNKTSVSIPRWVLVTTSALVEEKYQESSLDSIEEILNHLLEIYIERFHPFNMSKEQEET